MKTIFTAMLLSLVSLFSCQQPKDTGIKTVGVDEFEQIIQNENVQLLDVRTPEEYEYGHIKGFTMINLRSDDFLDKVNEMLVKDLPVAVYCRGGGRSLIAADTLLQQGFKTIYNLEKGFRSWEEAGKPVVAKEAEIKSVGVDEFEQIIQNKRVQLLDVRTPEEYAEGHLKDAKLIDIKADGFSAKVDEEKVMRDLPVAVYCRSGRRSLVAADSLLQKGFRTVYNLEKGYNAWVEAGKPVEK